jgi:ferredoxin
MPSPGEPGRRGSWLCLGLGVLLCAAASAPAVAYSYHTQLIFFAAGLALVTAAYRSLAVAVETGFVLYLVAGEVSHSTLGYLPLLTVVLMYLTYRVPAKAVRASILPVVAAWFGGSTWIYDPEFNTYGLAVIAACFLSLALFTWDALTRLPPAISKIDLILSSATGNTAHYAHAFAEGARRSGATVTMHRFHYYREFEAELTGDALVLAFPVIGFKPPWPFLGYLLRRLPRGSGKPAFVVSTAAGGPENAGLLLWAILRLKGYRYAGRSWAIYPVNIPTIRLGPAALWRWLDRLLPRRSDLANVRREGEEFASGLATGQPVLVWPLPLILIGLALDNPWINTLCYRNYAWRRRCIACGLCAEYCPARRLHMVAGAPRARGTCTLCLGCVNLCPTNAMQLVCWTEYGNRYRPRWPEMTVLGRRGREDEA